MREPEGYPPDIQVEQNARSPRLMESGATSALQVVEYELADGAI